ncbi:MAG: EAL domain-containing protein [Georgfuchsia sp.]
MAVNLSRTFGRLTLFSRLIIVVLLAFAATVPAVLYLTVHYAAVQARLELAAEYQNELDTVGLAITPGLFTRDPERIKHDLNQFRRSPSVTSVGFRDVSDSVEFSRESPVALTTPEWFSRWSEVYPMKGTRPLMMNGVYFGVISLEVSPVPIINQAWARAQRQLLILALTMIMVFIGIWVVLRHGLKPLLRLADGTQVLASGNFSLRLESRGSPELRATIDGFNHMAESVEQMVSEIQANNISLSRSEENLRVTMQSIGDAVIATDAEGRVTLMNEVAENLTGWSLADALGQPVVKVFHIINESSRQEVESPVAIVLREGRIVGLANHTLLVARDGTERPIADSGAPIRISAGDNILGVVLVFRDQTEEHQHALTLRNSQQLYASLAEASPAGIFRTDAEGRLVYANAQLGNIFRCKLHLNTIRWSDVFDVHPDDHSRVWSAWATALRDGTSFQTQTRISRSDGSVMWSSLRTAPLHDAQGCFTGFVGTVLDVTAEQENACRAEHMTRLYATLSGINNAIVHSKDAATLFPEICRVAHQEGGFVAVLLVLADWETHAISLGAFAPEAAECIGLQMTGVYLQADNPAAQSLSCRTLLSGERQVSNDYLAEMELAASPFLADMQALHGVAGLSVPIKLGGRAVAALTFFASERDYFTDDMIALADETAQDVSFALTNFERERLRHSAEEKLRSNEERLRLALHATKMGTYEIDMVRDRISIDAVCATILGLTPEPREMSSAEGLALVNKTAYPRVVTEARQADQETERALVEELHITPDGTKRWLRWSGAVMEWMADGKPARFLGTVTDITEAHAQEDHLRMTAMMFDNARDAIIIADHESNIVATNRAFGEITGYAAEEVLGKNPSLLKSGSHDSQFYDAIWRDVHDAGYWQGEVWNRRKDGVIYPCAVSLSAVRRPDGEITHYLWIGTDITKQKEFEERITRLAYHDSLTDLPNRVLLRDRVQQNLASAHRDGENLALLFLDLDHFKNINDSLGHAVGDQLLMEVAKRMHFAVRNMDTVGRLGGDEFLLLLPGADADAAAHVAQKLLVEVAKPFRVNSHSLTVTSSIGISLFPKDGHSFDDLMKSADTAMYKAKESGRNAYYFASMEMNQAVFQRLVLESNLRRAIDGKEFVLFYQPQYQMPGQDMIGAEALIRWQQPELGFVSPRQFIPIAEESGLIESIGEWVLAEACGQIKTWQDKRLQAVRIGINISTRQFRARNLLQVVDQALEQSGLSGEFLEVEITESLLAEDMDYTLAVLRALKERGIQISVDDFGTGYSSLSYLKRFPIDRLKIDQSFIRDLDSDVDDWAIATAIVTLGHSMGMKIIAEGVETTEQLQILRNMGCDQVQGFLLARPMSSANMSDLLFKGKPN